MYIKTTLYSTKMGRLIGYARVSTASQTTDPQVEQLKQAGCDRIFHEKVSSRTPEEKRIQLQAALATLEEGDCLCISNDDTKLITNLPDGGIEIFEVETMTS